MTSPSYSKNKKPIPKDTTPPVRVQRHVSPAAWRSWHRLCFRPMALRHILSDVLPLTERTKEPFLKFIKIFFFHQFYIMTNIGIMSRLIHYFAILGQKPYHCH
jgi:hypothetical protein